MGLTATPDGNSVFAGWSGDCSGSNPNTTVAVDANRVCTATFNLPTPVGGVTAPGRSMALWPWLAWVVVAAVGVTGAALLGRRTA